MVYSASTISSMSYAWHQKIWNINPKGGQKIHEAYSPTYGIALNDRRTWYGSDYKVAIWK